MASHNYDRFIGVALTKAHSALLKVLVGELLSKVAAFVDPNFDAGESKSRRGRKKGADNLIPVKKMKVDKLTGYASNPQAEFEDTESTWISALLLAILFQDANVVLAPATMRIIPSLALLMKSDEVIDGFLTAQGMASLVCNGC